MSANYVMTTMITQIPDTLSIMGVNVTPFDSYSHAVECVSDRIEKRQKTAVIAVNPEKIYRAYYDENLKKMINDADIKICDGIGVVYAAKLLLGKNLKRCTGIQLFLNLVQKASQKEFKVYLLGASDESNWLASSNLFKMYPSLKIVGRHGGYFKDSQEIIKQINESQAEMLFVAMGSPKQEFWIAEHRETISVLFCMGVGGTFDVISGCVKWAPKIFRKTGTEFLHRLITNPKRLRRQLVLPKFVLMVLKEKFFGTLLKNKTKAE